MIESALINCMNSIDSGLLLIKLFLPFALAIPFLNNKSNAGEQEKVENYFGERQEME